LICGCGSLPEPLQTKWNPVRARWSLLVVLVSIGGGLVGGLVLAQRQLAFVPTAGLIVRIRSEERALLDGLGEQYRHFAATRRRLCPGVW
jgi:protein-S-isoprenylcysteine O-methyltransferase Ste14